jgi:hypothetical protein
MSNDETSTARIHALATEIVHQLATENYKELRAARGPVSDFVNALKRFRDEGYTIVDLPTQAHAEFDMYGPNEFGSDWLVNFPLWTREQGRSDLQLHLVFRQEGGTLVGYVDDIYVP